MLYLLLYLRTKKENFMLVIMLRPMLPVTGYTVVHGTGRETWFARGRISWNNVSRMWLV